MGYIYKITNNINGKIYIGKTTTTIQNRFKGHIKKAKGGSHNSYLQNALIKYGVENFSIEELDESDALDELNQKEKYWIEKLNARNRSIGYNQTSGGDSGDIFHSLSLEKQQLKREKHAKDTAQRIWINNGTVNKYINNTESIPEGFVRGRLSPSEETKKKMSESRKGRRLSKETIDKIVKTRKERGYKMSEATKDKLRKANIGRKFSDEINKKKGRPKFGKANPMYGKHYKWLTNGVVDIKIFEQNYNELPQYYQNGYRDGRSNKKLFGNQSNLDAVSTNE